LTRSPKGRREFDQLTEMHATSLEQRNHPGGCPCRSRSWSPPPRVWLRARRPRLWTCSRPPTACTAASLPQRICTTVSPRTARRLPNCRSGPAERTIGRRSPGDLQGWLALLRAADGARATRGALLLQRANRLQVVAGSTVPLEHVLETAERLLGLPPRDAELEALSGGTHPLALLLDLVERGVDLDPERLFTAQDAVRGAFGDAVAAAAVLGRMRVGEASGPLGAGPGEDAAPASPGMAESAASQTVEAAPVCWPADAPSRPGGPGVGSADAASAVGNSGDVAEAAPRPTGHPQRGPLREERRVPRKGEGTAAGDGSLSVSILPAADTPSVSPNKLGQASLAALLSAASLTAPPPHAFDHLVIKKPALGARGRPAPPSGGAPQPAGPPGAPLAGGTHRPGRGGTGPAVEVPESAGQAPGGDEPVPVDPPAVAAPATAGLPVDPPADVPGDPLVAQRPPAGPDPCPPPADAPGEDPAPAPEAASRGQPAARRPSDRARSMCGGC